MSRSPPSTPERSRPVKIAKMDDAINIGEAVTETQPIPSYRPDAKTRRYDRQLRLWASAGQRSLESARVLLIGCDATGAQALKNLILPGIAHFTILTPALTTSRDVATNFFLHPDSIGSSIAEETVRYLKELNPAVEGTGRAQDIDELLRCDPGFFTGFTLVICSNIKPETEMRLAELLWLTSANVGGPDIPILAVRNSGFVGRIEVQLREHCEQVVDSHPDTTHTLRIDQPFPTLEKYARELDLEAMDSMEHSHVPYIVLLVKAGLAWKDSHDGKLPYENDERKEFKALLNGWRKKGDEENFDEAVGQAYKVSTRSKIPYETQELLGDPKVKDITSTSKNLHLLLHTLIHYIKQAPFLPPTSPTLPDMHSSTTSYVALQNLYKNQFQADLATFRSILSKVLYSVGLPEDTITDEEITGFAKGVGGVGIIKGRDLRSRKEGTAPGLAGVLEKLWYDDSMFAVPNDGEEEGDEGEEEDVTAKYWPESGKREIGMCLAIMASERFYGSHSRWPGSSAGEEERDGKEMKGLVKGIIETALPDKQGEELLSVVSESIVEVVRGGFGTLPTTAGFLGGIVAQESIKLVTGQYVPVEGTVVVDLVTSHVEKFREL